MGWQLGESGLRDGQTKIARCLGRHPSDGTVVDEGLPGDDNALAARGLSVADDRYPSGTDAAGGTATWNNLGS